MPWAYDHEVHLCLREPDPTLCNIILESARNVEGSEILRGRCVTVHQAAPRDALLRALDLPVPGTILLGDVGSDDAFPPLRNGDILHYRLDPEFLEQYCSTASCGSRPSLVVITILGLFWAGRPAAWGLVFATVAHAVVTELHYPHWLWGPGPARFGPFYAPACEDVIPQLTRAMPQASRGFSVVPSVRKASSTGHQGLTTTRLRWFCLLAPPPGCT